MSHGIVVLAGVLVGIVVPVSIALVVSVHGFAIGSGRASEGWLFLLAAALLIGPAAGGYLADRLFHKTRRYDPDYDDRPPTDPA
jgi:hypothetical protein